MIDNLDDVSYSIYLQLVYHRSLSDVSLWYKETFESHLTRLDGYRQSSAYVYLL